MTPVSVPAAQMTPTQRNMTQRMAANPFFGKMQYVRLGNLAKAQRDGRLAFALPNGRRIVAVANGVQSKSESDYTWSGDFADSTGFMILVSDKGRVRGHITVGDEIYDLHPVSGSLHMLAQVNRQMFTPQACVVPKDFKPVAAPPEPPGKAGRQVACASPQTVRVLTLFTPAARQRDPNVVATARLAIAQTNQAFRNSAISAVNIQEAGIQEFNFVEQPNFNAPDGGNGIVQDLGNLAALPAAQALRNQFQADLVMLITDNVYGGLLGVAGVNLALPVLNPQGAYAISTVGAAATQFTYAHELGHLFGCRHQQCSMWPNGGCSDVPGGYQHGYGYLGRSGLFGSNGEPRATLMHQLGRTRDRLQGPESYVRILHYSNPGVEESRRATGGGDNNNARWLGEQFPTVVNYRPFAGALSAGIDGPTTLDPRLTYTWEAVYGCGSAPYSFQWAISTDGFNYGGVTGTGETLTTAVSFLFTRLSVTLRCVVTSADGQTATTFLTLSRSGNLSRISAEQKREPLLYPADHSQPDSVRLYDAYPNPSAGYALLDFSLPRKADVRLAVTDWLGRTVAVLAEGEHPAGRHTTEYSFGNLPPGIYFYRLTTGGFDQTKRLIITK